MTMIGDIYIPGIGQSNPPRQVFAENQSDEVQGRLTFTCDTLADLRAIKHNPQNLKATLLGELAAFDGLLQGDYYWVESVEADNGSTIVRGNDYSGFLWKKLN